MSVARPNLERLRPRRTTLLVAGALVVAELVVLAWYVALSGDQFTDPLQLVYPFVWVNVGAIAVWRTSIPPTTARRRRVGLTVATAYGLLLGYAGGVLAPGAALGGPHRTGLVLRLTAPPGWSPAVVYSGDLVWLFLVPFKLVGYLALAYLVYATVVDAAGSAVTGVLGLFSCVSCSWPIVASVLTGAVGAGGAVSAASFGPTYGTSTAVFVVTVALLYWRPFGRWSAHG